MDGSESGICTMTENGVNYPSFELAIEAVKAETHRRLNAAPSLIRGQMRHLSNSDGKYIRAASLLACAQDGRGAVPANAVPLAVSLELLHLATLVHDDVIDEADMRRGEATLQRAYGKRTAVICGDYLLCTALKSASRVKDRETYVNQAFPDYISRVCLGELRQQQNNRNYDMTILDYLRTIGGKTAALFEGAFHTGAILHTEDHRAIRLYSKVGKNIGMIFQLTDDCIDYEGDEAKAKKTVHSDYEQGVVTLPLIRALDYDPDFRRRVRSAKLPRAEINRAVARAGGVGYTAFVAGHYYEKTMHLLDELELSEEKRFRLLSILEQAYRRPKG